MKAWDDAWVVDFPTLGYLVADWIARHCTVPSGPFYGQPFVLDGWQLWVVCNLYRVKAGAKLDAFGLSNAAQFFYRRGLCVGPQKTGKSPLGAGVSLNEGVGPCLFAGWAKPGDVYRCSDHGCDCGWVYAYEPGEPMGVPRKKSLVQILASADDQRRNIYDPIQTMIRNGPLAEFVSVRDDYVKLPNNGRIDPISSSPRSKLGQPANFAVGDESGLYTGRLKEAWETTRRGIAGMGGRTLEITNPWDPMENSSAQQTFEVAPKDVFIFYRKPPAEWDYMKRSDRKKIHQYVYTGSPWVTLENIEAEAEELVKTNPVQARRFFGNELVQGQGSFILEPVWDAGDAPKPDEVVHVCAGFDGSRSGDWTALRLVTMDGWSFTPTYGPDNRPAYWNPELWPGGRIPRSEVTAAVAEIFSKYQVERMYCDPRHWETQIDQWAAAYGEQVVMEWPTNQIGRMFPALTRYLEDLSEGIATHEADPVMKTHALNARRLAKPGDRYILGKPTEHQKIDLLMAEVLAWEARADAMAAGWDGASDDNRVFCFV